MKCKNEKNKGIKSFFLKKQQQKDRKLCFLSFELSLPLRVSVPR